VSQQPAGAIELGLAQLQMELTSLPSALRDEFHQRLVDTEEPDHLWDLMGSLDELLQPQLMPADENFGGMQMLERSSMLGLFVRRIQLAFRNTSFEEICTLVTHFGQWVRAAADGGSAAPPQQPQPRDTYAPPSAWEYVLPVSQLEAHVHTLARQMEEGSLSCDSPQLEEQIAQLLDLAPHVPQVHARPHASAHMHPQGPMHGQGLPHAFSSALPCRAFTPSSHSRTPLAPPLPGPLLATAAPHADTVVRRVPRVLPSLF
jgi:hypothetical protein